MSGRHNYVPEAFHYNKQIRRNVGVSYTGDSFSPIESDDEENYLQKISSDNRNNPQHNQHNKNNHQSDQNDIKERLGRLESMLEIIIKKDTQVKEPKETFSITHETVRSDFSLYPRSHHFTTSMWLNRIQEISVRNNYNEKSTIQFMESQMSGIVKAWYKSLENVDFTWSELKLLITKTFPDNNDFITTLKRLVTRIKQADETMSHYYFSKMYLIDACKITGEDAVSCLIDGLNNELIQNEAKAQNYLTPETLYSQYLFSLPDYTVDYAPVSSDQEPSIIEHHSTTTTTTPPPPPPDVRSSSLSPTISKWYSKPQQIIQNSSVFPYSPSKNSNVPISIQNFEINSVFDRESQSISSLSSKNNFSLRQSIHTRLGERDDHKKARNRRNSQRRSRKFLDNQLCNNMF